MGFAATAWPKPASFICSSCDQPVEPDGNAYRGWRHVTDRKDKVRCSLRDLHAKYTRMGLAKDQWPK